VEVTDPRQQLESLLDEGVAILDIPARARNALEDAEIITIRQLLHKQPAELMELRNFNCRSLQHVYRALEAIGLKRTSKQPLPKGKVIRRTPAVAKTSQAPRCESVSQPVRPAKPAELVPPLERLSAEEALQRCLADLRIVLDNLTADNAAHPAHAQHLAWIVLYGTNRLPYPED
jgi:hypothetical protein